MFSEKIEAIAPNPKVVVLHLETKSMEEEVGGVFACFGGSCYM
jgi:hypothetical protein